MVGKSERGLSETARRRLKYAGVAFVVLGLVWLVIERTVIRIDRYRPDVVAAIEEATGMPVSIGLLELDLIPRPRLQAHGVSVGEGNFSATAGLVTVHARLRPLLDGRLDVTSLRVSRLDLRVPDLGGETVERIDHLIDALSVGPEDDDDEGGMNVSLERMWTRSALLFVGDDVDPLAEVSCDVIGAMPSEAELSVEARVRRIGGKPVSQEGFSISYLESKGDALLLAGSVDGGALAALLGALSSESVRLETENGAWVVAEDVRIGIDAETALLAAGRVTFDGVRLSNEEGEPIASNGRGELSLDDGVIKVTEADSKEFGFSGAIRPDFDENTYVLALSRARYLRGELQDVSAIVAVSDDAVEVRDVNARPGMGRIAGHARIGLGEEGLVEVDFQFDQVDAKILDDLLFEEPRELFGLLTGDVQLTAPAGDPKAMIAGANGTASWDAVEGTFGKLGFATKMLTALKTVEIINLKAPTLKDKGLVYNTCTGSVEFVDGVATFGKTELDGGAYAMDATGTVNFAQESTDVEVYVKVLESVSNIVEKVPVVGDLTTSITTDLVGVNVVLKGSPYDLETTAVPLGGKGVLGQTVGRVGKGLRKLLPGRKKKDEQKEDEVADETPEENE